GQQAFLVNDAFTVQFEADQHLEFQGADQQVAAPGRETLTRIESHAGWRDRRRPLEHRLLHSFALGADPDFGADSVIDPVGNHRPTVVAAGAHDIDLVAALRAVFVRPQLAAQRMQCRALHSAMPEAEYLRP